MIAVVAWMAIATSAFVPVILRVVNTPNAELHDAAYARGLLRHARLMSEQQQAASNSRITRGFEP